jgi:outer membrane protein assembly factor BamA
MFGLLSGLIFLCSCNSTKYLKDEEVLLDYVEIVIESDQHVDKVGSLKDQLYQFNKQVPNGNVFLFVPREWIYLKNQAANDTSWINKWSRKSLGEKPTLLDTQLISKSSEDMQNYLRNKKGYYEAEVKENICYCGKKAVVSYFVDPGEQYKINSLNYMCKDSTIKDKIDSLAKLSFLSVGKPIDALTFDIEKQRIVSSMQNMGYANFNLNNISIKGDSTGLDHAWDIFFEVLPPSDSSGHTKYRIGNIEVYTDFHQFQKTKNLSFDEIYSKKYLRESSDYIVKPSIIDRKIYLKPFEVYKAKNYDKTVQSLFNLNTYRFVKLQAERNPYSDTLIDYKILLTPQKNRWVFDLGTDLFFSNISRVDRNLVGFAIGSGLENRNAFGGSEKYKFSLETGVEFRAETQEINTFSLGLNNSLDIPKFTKTLNALKLGAKSGIVGQKAIKRMEDEGTSRISLGFNYIDIIDNYQISSFNTSYGFDIRFNNKNRVVYNQTGFNYADYVIRDSFDIFLVNNPLLQRSFQTTLFTGLLFKDMSYFYQTDNPGVRSSNWAFIANLETSGLEVHLANSLGNLVSGRNDVWRLSRNVAFEKFVKLDLDWRWYKNLTKESQLAARFRSGVSLPYGKDRNGDSNVVSYIKQFLIGGPSSLRGWRPMQLGPGSYIFTDPDPISFFQRGDIIMEFSLEYRFKLFWLMDGGLFFDGGNIWTLRSDPERPGSRFTSDFIDQFALGYGWGLRFDFSYFLIRFDFGYKLRNPYEDPETKSHFIPLDGQGFFGNLNVAVNYPF